MITEHKQLTVGEASSILLQFTLVLHSSSKNTKRQKRKRSLIEHVQKTTETDNYANAFYSIMNYIKMNDPNVVIMLYSWLEIFISKKEEMKSQHQVIFELIRFWYTGDEICHNWIHKQFIQILQNHSIMEDYDKKQQKRFKLGACTLLFKIMSADIKHKDKSDANKSVQIHSSSFIQVNSEGQLNELIYSLWDVIRNESAKVNERRQPTLLTTCASDCFILLLFLISKSINHKGLLAKHFNLLILFIEELILWYTSHRLLSTEALTCILNELKKLKELQTAEKQIALLEKKEIDATPFHKFLSAIWTMYTPYLIENSKVFFSKKSMNDYLIAVLVEIEELIQKEMSGSEDIEHIQNQLNFTFICVCLLLGKMRTKDIEKRLDSPISTKKQDVTIKQLMISLIPKGMHSKSEIVQVLSIYLIKELTKTQIFSGSSSDILIVDTLMTLLDESDITSKAVASFIAENAISNSFILSDIFARIDSSAIPSSDKKVRVSKRKNALIVLSEIFKMYHQLPKQARIDEFYKQVAKHLLNRIEDEELTLRSHAAELFVNLDPEFIIPRIVKLELDRSDRVRSAAHLALTKIMTHHSESIQAFLILIDAIRDANFVDNIPYDHNVQSPAQIMKQQNATKNTEDSAELAKRVLSLLPQYFQSLSPKVIPELAREIINKFLLCPNDSTLVLLMNKTFNTLLTFQAETQKDYILKQQLIAFEIIIKSAISLISERINSQDIFEKLAPLLILKTIPTSVLYRPELISDQKTLLQELFSILFSRMMDKEENKKIRQLCAELCGFMPPNFVMPEIIRHLKDTQTSSVVLKLLIYTICNALTAQKALEKKDIKTDDMDIYILQFAPMLFEMLERNAEVTGNEAINLQEGIMDCLSLTVQYCINRPNLTYDPLEFILYSISDKPITGLSVCMAHILTMCTRRMSLHENILLSQRAVHMIAKFIETKCLNSSQYILTCALLQLLLHITYELKSGIHPYSDTLLRIVSMALRSQFAEVRLASIKLITAILHAREDVLEQTRIIDDILKRLQSMAMIDESAQVRELAQKIIEILTQPIEK